MTGLSLELGHNDNGPFDSGQVRASLQRRLKDKSEYDYIKRGKEQRNQSLTSMGSSVVLFLKSLEKGAHLF